jgi:hypothetical protein
MDGGASMATIWRWGIIAALVVVGGGLVLFSQFIPWDWAHALARDLGAALFIAGILAAFVDTYFKRELSRDAFLAAFRYVLPFEFRNEVSKILRFEFIAERQLWTVKIEKTDDKDVVLVTTSYQKTIRNKTSFKKPFSAKYVIPELNFSNGKAAILECGLEYEEEKKLAGGQRSSTHSIERETEPIQVFPDKTVKSFGKATQYRRTNDLVYEVFLAPAVNPEIEVLVDGDFEYHVEFGTSGYVERSQYGNKHRLDGVYFPGQHMFVRWWPRSKGDLGIG